SKRDWSSDVCSSDLASDPEPGSVSAYAAKSSPEASLGKYFSFCSSFPKNTIGNEPIPTCAPCVTENPPARENFSVIKEELILSRSEERRVGKESMHC